MNEKLSALMDGELDREEVINAIKLIGGDSARCETWDCYHLIGESLRGESSLGSRATTDAIFAKLAAEPTVLVPAAARAEPPVAKRTRLAMAMAASIVTVSAIGVVAFKQQSAPLSTPLVAQQSAPAGASAMAVSAPSAAPTPAQQIQVNDYLAVHRQFTNPGAFQNATLRAERAPVANRQ